MKRKKIESSYGTEAVLQTGLGWLRSLPLWIGTRAIRSLSTPKLSSLSKESYSVDLMEAKRTTQDKWGGLPNCKTPHVGEQFLTPHTGK